MTIKAGDVLEWLSASHAQRAVATESENGEIRVRLHKGGALSLNDVVGSKGLTVNGQPYKREQVKDDDDDKA